MHIEVDPEGTLHIANKTDDALADLAANFEVCDRAAEAAAVVLAAEAPGVAASLRDVAACEGADQVKICTAAKAATFSLRGAVGDFTRLGDCIKDQIVDMTEAVGDAVEQGVDRLQQGVSDIGRVGEKVAHRAYGIAEMMSGPSKTLRRSDR